MLIRSWWCRGGLIRSFCGGNDGLLRKRFSALSDLTLSEKRLCRQRREMPLSRGADALQGLFLDQQMLKMLK
jgi:hypothetical protein